MEGKIIIQNTISRHIEYHRRIRATLPFPRSPFPVCRLDQTKTTRRWRILMTLSFGCPPGYLPAYQLRLLSYLSLSLSLCVCVCVM